VHIDGFTPIIPDVPVPPPHSTVAAHPPPSLGAAEESDAVRLGDVLLGVSGVCTVGLDVAATCRAIAVARSVTLNGLVVLHLCEAAVDGSLVEEVALQLASAAAQLIGGRAAVEAVQAAVYKDAVTVAAAEMLTAAAAAGGGGERGAAAAAAAAMLPLAAALPRTAGTSFAGSRSTLILPPGGATASSGVLDMARSAAVRMDVDRVISRQ